MGSVDDNDNLYHLGAMIAKTCFVVLSMAILGCSGETSVGGEDAGSDSPLVDVDLDGGIIEQGRYTFTSRFLEGESGVNHTGQTTRQVLMQDLAAEMARISDLVLGGGDTSTVDDVGEVTAILNSFVRSGSAGLGASRPLPVMPRISGSDSLCQHTYADLGDANLLKKIAGQDDVTDFRDWDGDESAMPAFAGWIDASHLSQTAGGVDTPVHLIDTLIDTFEKQVIACIGNTDSCPKTEDDKSLALFVTPDGIDLKTLLFEFLLGAINYSQATDDYLDDATPDKGLNTDNTEAREKNAESSVLEHAWDEGYGYFGAARDYLDYTTEELAGSGGRPEYNKGYHSYDEDPCIDVFREYNFPFAYRAGAADVAAVLPTSQHDVISAAFFFGRALISGAPSGVLTAVGETKLGEYRDVLVSAWEKVVAATLFVHLDRFDNELGKCATTFDHNVLATSWSTAKAALLALQFNPRSLLVDDKANYDKLVTAIGDKPVLCSGDVAAYRAALLEARNTLTTSYGFNTL